MGFLCSHLDIPGSLFLAGVVSTQRVGTRVPIPEGMAENNVSGRSHYEGAASLSQTSRMDVEEIYLRSQEQERERFRRVQEWRGMTESDNPATCILAVHSLCSTEISHYS